MPAPAETCWAENRTREPNHLRNDYRPHLENLESVLDGGRGDIKLNPSMDMEMLVLCVLEVPAFKIRPVHKWRQFSLRLDLVISKRKTNSDYQVGKGR